MKRAISGLLAVMIMMLVLCPVATASNVYKVTLSIHFVSNLIFSKYDVDMYLNDLELVRLPHGKDYLGSFYAEEGANTLYFYEHGDKSVNGKIMFYVAGDTNITCRLYCYNDKVDLDKVKITADTSTVSKSLPENNFSQEIAAPTEAPTQEPTTEPTPEPTMEPTAEPTQVVTPVPTEMPTPELKPVTFADVNLQEMSDEELENAAAAIKAEQRARIKTRIVLDKTSIVLSVGKTGKVSGYIADLPDGEKEPALEWSTSDKAVATCQKGIIKAIGAGKAVITCQALLSDGTSIYENVDVQVIIPVSSVSADKKSINLKGGETHQLAFSIKPKNATITDLVYSTSDKKVASVNENGVIEGVGNGTATITAKTTDGSNKSASITVKVIDHRITQETAMRVALTAIGNDTALDIFTPDGNHFDKKKFHNYRYFSIGYDVYHKGSWTTKDGGNVWHVSQLIVQSKKYGGYDQYDFDIRFDGKYYYTENGWHVGSNGLNWLLEKKDKSKYGEDDLSDLDYYTYFIITPEQIEN